MKLLFTPLVALLPLASFGQLQGQAFVDSLEAVIEKAPDDSIKVKLLDKLVQEYKVISPAGAAVYAQQEADLAAKLHLDKGLVRAYANLGLCCRLRSDYPEAVRYFNKALDLCGSDQRSVLYGHIISNLAIVHQELEEYDKALDFNRRSLELDIANGDSMNIGGDYGNMGIVYMLEHDYEKALDYDRKSMEIFRLQHDDNGVAHNYGNIGNIYRELKDYNKALEFDTRALDIFRQQDDIYSTAINTGNIGGIYLAMAIDYDSLVRAGVKLPMSSRKALLSRAVEFLGNGIAISRQIEQLDNLIEYNAGLSEAYARMDNYKGALDAYKEYVLYRDSVYSGENRERIANLETERALALKDKQIQIDRLEVARRRNDRFILFIALGLSLGLVVYILRRLLQHRRNAQRLAQERKTHLERIEKQKMVMGDISHRHSHEVSDKVSTILGLVAIFNTEDYADPDNKVVIDGIAETAEKLDGTVKDLIRQENMLNSDRPW